MRSSCGRSPQERISRPVVPSGSSLQAVVLANRPISGADRVLAKHSCGSMPCDPSNQSHDCCKSMVSSQSPSVLPVAHVTLQAPVVFVADILPSPQVHEFSGASRADFEAPQHSPPELYTLHSSFLI